MARPEFNNSERASIRKKYMAGDTLEALAKEFHSDPCEIRKVVTEGRGCIKCEEREQSYRENMVWAMAAAGEFIRTGLPPLTCPNNTAWFLYTQACDEPKDFMAKVNSLEAKNDNGDEAKRQLQSSTKKSLAEIEAFLDFVETEEFENGETQEEKI
ncbi:MAG: hypothetical protein WC919_04070 [Candidatus Paceibacterota bacterium]|jgi:hypothetical protein